MKIKELKKPLNGIYKKEMFFFCAAESECFRFFFIIEECE